MVAAVAIDKISVKVVFVGKVDYYLPQSFFVVGIEDVVYKLYDDFGNLYTINRIGAFFVVRAKINVRFKPVTWKRRLPPNVVSDAIGYFTVYKSAKDYPEKLRKVVCIDPEDGTGYIFLTNSLTASAETIAELYRNRWSVELFFKWIKQHLRIKRFRGTSENAVRIQIYCAIITYCLVAIVQHDMKLERSLYEVIQILGISLTDKNQSPRPLRQIEFQKYQCSL